MRRSLTKTTLLIAALVFTTACSIQIREKEEEEDSETSTDPWQSSSQSSTYNNVDYNVSVPLPVETRGQECVSADAAWYTSQYGSYFRYSAYECYENDDYKWRTSCPTASCQGTQVYVHYMLMEELGEGLTVHIEAFDNDLFSGYPKGTVTIQDFHAKTGEYDTAELYLEPGEYYLRAFVSNQDTAPTPYPMGGMELVAGEPMGIYGALSGAQKIIIAPNTAADPVHIKLDKLFKKPGSEPESKAHLRTVITTELHAEISTGRKVYIEMFTDDDFERIPDYQFEIVSELLKIEGEQGTAEFVSPSLEVNDYFVRVYVDSNSNGFLDIDELSGTYSQGDLIKFVRIQEDTIRSIAIDLE